MKTTRRLTLLLVASASLAVSLRPAANEPAGPYLIHLTSVVDARQKLLFKDGDPASTVRRAIGQPDSIIGDTVWVYRRLAREGGGEVRYAAPQQKCDTMLVSFLPASGRGERKVGEIAKVAAADVDPVAAALIGDPKYVPNRVAAARTAMAPAAPPANLPFLIHVTAVVNYDDAVLFCDGDTEERVVQAVGQPSEVLPGEVWAYRRYENHQLKEVRYASNPHGCETTLVTFTPGAPGSGRIVTAIVMASAASLPNIAVALKQDPDYLQKRVLAWHDPASDVRASIATYP